MSLNLNLYLDQHKNALTRVQLSVFPVFLLVQAQKIWLKHEGKVHS